MPEEPATNEGAENTEEGEGAQDATPQEPSKGKEQTPPWGSDEEFDPQKAWRLIQNLRDENSELKPKAQKLKELEDEQKSEQERLTEKLTETEKRAAEAELKAARLEVATEKGLPKSSVKFLTGTTAEELEASADELLALMKPDDDEGASATSRRPKERLKPGASPDSEPEVNPSELADSILKEGRL